MTNKLEKMITFSCLLVFFLLQSNFPNATCQPCYSRCSWLAWESWSSCSRTCGGGTQYRRRPLCCKIRLTFTECVNECGVIASDASVYRFCNTHCLNGGRYNYRCQCTGGFYGTCCSHDVDECATDICQNGGSCENIFGSYNCDCDENWSGKDCTIDLCNTKPASLIFLVDSSHSTSSARFQEQLDFVADVISGVTIADERIRVAVVTYATLGYSDILFDSYENKTDLQTQVRNIQYKNGTTHIERGCDEARRIIPVDTGTAQFVFLLTDGMSTDITGSIEGIHQLKSHLYRSSVLNRVIVIPYGDDVRHDILYKMSDDPYLRDIQAPFNNASLYSVFQALVDRRCTACYETDTYDVVILVDISSVASMITFNLQLTFIQKLVEKINTYVLANIYQIGEDHIQLGIVTFSDTPEPFMWLNTTYNLDNFARMFNSMQKDIYNSSSELSIALKFVNDKFLFNGSGARSDARKLVIIFNTGFDSNEDAIMKEANNLKQNGALIVAIGIGDQFKDDHIIAEASSAYHAYFIDNIVPDIYMTLLAKDLVYTHCTDRVNA